MSLFVAALQVFPVAKVQAGDQQIAPGPKDRCAVCGMFVAKYPNWIAVVVFRGGERVYFDGPKDMFRYVHSPEKYGSRSGKQDISAILVKDYYTLEQIPARQAFFVAGSDVLGPMGRELIPLKGKKEAETFLSDHQGRKIFSFDQVTPSVLAELE